ncbi:hypothetical protein [Microbacterium sp. Root61]|uniref:hypothetical protein n=1 Tax=Microbacterium sp. Root61 TaxID=1736570 RepID=UPI000B0D4D7E|nr:hypothetical protein [Microbacterium sp. Root61]
MSPSPKVPADQRAAYDAATPEPFKYLDAAAWELVQEQDPARTIFNGEAQAKLMEDRLPDVLARAEHLSRSAQSWEAVVAPKLAVEAELRRIAEETCPVCREVNPPITRHFGEHLPNGERDGSGWLACRSCAETARALWSEAQRTRARVKAVSAALSL